jgi:hypothetical protein
VSWSERCRSLIAPSAVNRRPNPTTAAATISQGVI